MPSPTSPVTSRKKRLTQTFSTISEKHREPSCPPACYKLDAMLTVRQTSNGFVPSISPTRGARLATLIGTLLLCTGQTYAAPDSGPWPKILSSVGLESSVTVVEPGAPGPAQPLLDRVEHGAYVILVGDSPVARAFGFVPQNKHVAVQSVVDQRSPKLSIIWEQPVELPVFEIPIAAQVYARERWEQAPLMAGMRRGSGAVLWVAASPGAQGYERFPYLLQALGDLGLHPPAHSAKLWAFFDSAYRTRVDLDYFAERWRASGIGALHVAGWHNFEPDPQRDEYLRRLIDACHRRAIAVYVWLELPHVSEQFWADHPEWREKTAVLQDAELDWRKLINLSNPQASAAIGTGVRDLIRRFDWDGVNLAELYFESLEGDANPSRFTPMNDDVRAEFKKINGFDPLEIFKTEARDPARLRAFLDYRAELSRRLQTHWIGEIEAMRAEKPDLDLVLTHVDDRFDTGMRDRIGADASRVLPMLDHHDFTFLIEDPATIWNLGPQRYPQIAARYQPLTKRTDKLAIDINVVERYQDVYPTKQQTGTELFQLVHLAASAFPRVTLYFENSILAPDLALLAASSARVDRIERVGAKTIVESPAGVGISWNGPALVNGRLWPVQDAKTLWLPPGAQAVEPAPAPPALRMYALSGNLRSANAAKSGVDFSYENSARTMVWLNEKPASVEIDGAPVDARTMDAKPGWILFLPRGQHLVSIAR